MATTPPTRTERWWWEFDECGSEYAGGGEAKQQKQRPTLPPRDAHCAGTNIQGLSPWHVLSLIEIWKTTFFSFFYSSSGCNMQWKFGLLFRCTVSTTGGWVEGGSGRPKQTLVAQNWVIVIAVVRWILTRCKLIGRFDGGGGSMNVCLVLMSSGFSSSSMSSSTSLPFVSPRSYHSTVTDRCCGLIFDTIAEWTRPKRDEENGKNSLEVQKITSLLCLHRTWIFHLSCQQEWVLEVEILLILLCDMLAMLLLLSRHTWKVFLWFLYPNA